MRATDWRWLLAGVFLLISSVGEGRCQDAARSDRTIAAILEKPITIDVEKVPLADVAHRLAEKASVAIILDRFAIADAGLDVQTPVSLKLGPVKLRTILRQICRPLDIVVVPREDHLLLTTEDEASQLLETRVYNIRDLQDYELREQRRMNPGLTEQDLALDPNSLELLIRYVAGNTSWGTFGGPGTLAVFRETLVVSQTAANLEKIEALLAKLRQILRHRETNQSPYVAPLTESQRRLQQQVTVDFDENPLCDVLTTLGKDYKITFTIDEKSLRDAGLAPTVPITCDLNNVSLTTALRAMLEEFDLDYVIDDDVVIVLTADEASQIEYAEVYDVHDLVRFLDGGNSYDDYDVVLELVTSTVAPTTWEFSGPADGSRYLGTVTWLQMQSVHGQIAELLAKLRKARREPPPALVPAAATVPPVDPQAIELRVYKLPWSEPPHWAPPPGTTLQLPDSREAATRHAQAVAKAIPTLIEPKTWQDLGGAGRIHLIPSPQADIAGVLCIRQSVAVHQQIVHLLRDLNAAR